MNSSSEILLNYLFFACSVHVFCTALKFDDTAPPERQQPNGCRTQQGTGQNLLKL